MTLLHRASSWLVAPACLLVAGCAQPTATPAVTSLATATACTQLAAPQLPGARTTLTATQAVAATDKVPAHCVVDGEINARTGIDGKRYAIRFRLRLPQAGGWNQRFYMRGGGGTNGVLVDPQDRLEAGYAVIGTDGGHDNQLHNDPNAGGTSAFGVDPQARVDFAYNAYDQVTQVGKALLAQFYGRAAGHAYFEGCSEGGREALLMSQRFPEHYDGIIAGDPVLHIPLGPMAGLHTTQLFAGLAERAGHRLPNGEPALGKTYSDPELLLVRNAVLGACDALDGLADGIVDNQPACTAERVAPALQALQCTGAKNDSCLSAEQLGTLRKAFLGPLTSKGVQLYADWQWDGGIGGKDGDKYNQAWRSWWIGSADGKANDAIKLRFATAEAVIYSTPPQVPIRADDALKYAMGYDFDRDPITLFVTARPYTQSTAAMTFADAVDLRRFQARRGRLMVYHGASDSSVSVKDTLRWYDAMDRHMGTVSATATRDFARMFVVPGMGHCRGGPATDSFDMLPQLVQWVEQGQAPDAVPAKASAPGYFNVAARSRPLCPWPQQARYLGSGDINDARNFACRAP